MGGVTRKILIAFVAQAHASEQTTSQFSEFEDKLFDLMLMKSPLQHADLENTTLRKPGHLAMPHRTPSLRPLHRTLHSSLHPPLSSFRFSGHSPPIPGVSSSPWLKTWVDHRTQFSRQASTGTQTEPDLSSLRQWPQEQPRIVVLGGGFGGLYTALKLAALKWGGRVKPSITLVDSQDRFLFKPLMYELISGEATMDQVAPSFQDLIKDTGVVFMQQEATDVTVADPDTSKAGRVHLENGSLDYDWLVLGTGATTNLDLAPGAREYALGFATLDDVGRLEESLQDLEKRAAMDGGIVDVGVVGGGAGGVELATTVAERLSKNIGSSKTRVSLYVAGNSLMDDFAKEAGEVAKENLEAKGVTVYYNHRVEQVEADQKNGDMYTLRFSNVGAGEAKEVSTNLVLWTAGAKPVQLGFPSTEGKDPISIEPTLRVKGRKREFAIGDVAGMGMPATAQVAIQQADYCAWNIYASIAGKDLLDFRYTHLGNLVALGKVEGSATLPIPGVGDVTVKGPLASALRKAAYIYRMPTAEQRIKVGLEWFSKPELWVPQELPKDAKDLQKLNPLAGIQRPA